MKKTSKSSKTPAPAKKSSPAAPKASTVRTVKKTAPKAITTTITAHLDVGFGNVLYLRGEGPGLSWDKGVVMECVADDRWAVVLTESARPFAFKFLINDTIWSVGEDYAAKSGVGGVFKPEF